MTDADAVLVTVVAVEGSAPRDPGAKMLVTANTSRDTIGGGHLELEAIAVARDLLATNARPAVRRFALGARLGQCCGGSVVLLFETPTPQSDVVTPAVAATVIEAPATGMAVGSKLVATATSVSGHWKVPALETAAVQAARGLLAAAATRARTTVVLNHMLFLDPLRPAPAIVLFGAGHIGRALATILGTLPCTVTWVDERPEQLPPTWPPNVQAEATDDPEGVVDAAPPAASFLVMTHSHLRDMAIVERVLRRGDFAYLGMVGSRAKRRRFEQRLCARGIDPATLARLTCPIGLAGVPGKSPGAIAVAAAAELLTVWRGG